jgi:hypothetical protein
MPPKSPIVDFPANPAGRGAIHVVGVGADFELTQPHKAGDPAIGSFGEQGQKPSAALHVQAPRNTGRDRPFGGDQRVGTAPFDR